MGHPNELESIKKSLKKIKIMNLVILMMLLTLIIMNTKDMRNQSIIPQELVAQKELPALIAESDINNLLEDVQRTINSRDSVRVYELLGDYAQTLITVQDIEKRLADVKYYGNILKIAYSHYEYLGTQNDADWFILKCVTRFENGNGTINLYIRVSGDTWGFSGLYIDIDDLEKAY